MEHNLKLEHQLCFEVYKASSNFSKMYAKVLEPFHLTFPQYLVLLVLWEEDDMMMKDIGTRLGHGTGTLTPIINRMIEQGRLTKQQSVDDKRSWIISLTEQAEKEKNPISKAVYEKLIDCNFLDVTAQSLMKNVKQLNAFFADMDL